MTGKKVTTIPATPKHTERDIRKRKLRVAAYCRVSTGSEEQLNSYKSQIEFYTAKIEENPNWTMAGIFADEGISGVSTKKRKQFNKMIQQCKKGRIDLILTKSVSRFARNTLDCIQYTRILRNLGIGVFFEKEGVNSLDADDETMLTICGVFAQNESESLSKNVKLGFQQKFKAGKVSFHYDGFLGYRRGPDGSPEIDPDEAAIVRRIYHRFLAGQSIATIKRDLEADGIPSPRGKEIWAAATIQNMLRNEKYIGDALLQKTFVTDVLTKKVQKNNGELPKYYVEGNHPAIIEKEIWDRVQEELARRSGKRQSTSKRAKTELSKYSSKYALTELLVCGCCGTPYRRVTWSRPDGKKVVWRCINRLEHGKKNCRDSVTVEESKIHEAVLSAIGEAVTRQELMQVLKGCVEVAVTVDQRVVDVYKARNRIGDLQKALGDLLSLSGKVGSDDESFDERFKEISDEIGALQTQIADYEQSHGQDTGIGQQVDMACGLLDAEPLVMSEFSDQIIRQLIDTIKVMDDGTIRIFFKDAGGGCELEQRIPA